MTIVDKVVIRVETDVTTVDKVVVSVETDVTIVDKVVVRVWFLWGRHALCIVWLEGVV